MKKIFTLILAVFAVLSVNATEIFSMKLVDGVANLTIDAGSEVALTSTQCTMTDGATVTLCNGHGSSAKDLIANGVINLGGSGASYMYVGLPKGVTLKTGDVIKLVEGSKAGGAIDFDGTKQSNDNMDANNEFTVPEAGNGKNAFYIWRGATKPTFKGVVVERNENQVVAPVITISNGTITMASSTEGATIYYSTTTGVTPENGTVYSSPIAITASATYYAIAAKEGLETSKEVSKSVEYYTIPSTAKLSATLQAPSALSEGSSDVALDNITVGTFTATPVEEDAVLSNTTTYNSNPNFAGFVKVKKTITIANSGNENIVGIKVIGISNSDDNSQAVTAEGMSFTTDSNFLPCRTVEDPNTVELVATTPAKSFNVYFSGQARVKFEVYTGTGTSIKDIQATLKTSNVKKVVKKGQVIIVKNGNEFNAAGAQIK